MGCLKSEKCKMLEDASIEKFLAIYTYLRVVSRGHPGNYPSICLYPFFHRLAKLSFLQQGRETTNRCVLSHPELPWVIQGHQELPRVTRSHPKVENMNEKKRERTDGRTDRRTHPLIEMRGRIYKKLKKFTAQKLLTLVDSGWLWFSPKGEELSQIPSWAISLRCLSVCLSVSLSLSLSFISIFDFFMSQVEFPHSLSNSQTLRHKTVRPNYSQLPLQVSLSPSSQTSLGAFKRLGRSPSFWPIN